MIKYKFGDIFKGDENIIIHGCNCFHTMGGGIAASVKRYYPGAYEADKETIYGDKNKLGTYSKFITERTINKENGIQVIKKLIIINAYTQFDFGGHRVNADYGAIESVMQKINRDFPEPWSISMPKIGAGLAGGIWEVIEKIIEKSFDNRDVFVYIY